MKQFNDLVLAAVKEGFSDLHIIGNQPLVFRKNGTIHTDTLSSPKIDFQAGSDGEPQYIIDDNENLEDLIAQLDKAAIPPGEEQ